VLVTRSSFRREIIDAWDGVCAYCGCQPKNITLDHMIAKARGGPTTRANQVAACARCNASKGDSDVWDWSRSSVLAGRQESGSGTPQADYLFARLATIDRRLRRAPAALRFSAALRYGPLRRLRLSRSLYLAFAALTGDLLVRAGLTPFCLA
jgi:hypothetical protein